MRRTAPTLSISPKLLKHFAAATIVITLLLALFASDEDWGARAQIEAAQTKNQLAATEAERLGTGKLASKLKVRTNTGGGFGADEGGGPPVDGGWSRSAPKASAEIAGPRQRVNGIPVLEQREGASVTVKEADIEDVREPDPAKRKNKKAAAFMPDAQQIESIQEASRQRTGGRTSGLE